jgi:small subunit ribosomal protein S20
VIHAVVENDTAYLAGFLFLRQNQFTMPNSTSAKKRLRQSIDRRLHNRSIRSNVRTLIRKARAAVSAGDVETSTAAFQLASKKLDQAAAKNVIHANTAARIKSRLSRAVKNLKAAKA